MKKLILLLSCFSLLCFAKCNKDKIPKAVLPPVTQEGKNTVGFTIDGEVWIPYYKCGFGRNPCGEISARYSTPFAAVNGIGFQFSRASNGKFSALTIYTWPNYTITTTGNKIDSIGVEYRDSYLSDDGYFIGPVSGSKFIITKIDFTNQIISGEFELILRERKDVGTVTNNLITLKEGRFDFQFNACKCSQ